MAHNDLIELTLNHLNHASLTPEFFEDFARIAPVICEGVEKQVEHCEQNCSRYYHCSNIAEVDDRNKKWDFTILSFIYAQILDIRDFFYNNRILIIRELTQ